MRCCRFPVLSLATLVLAVGCKPGNEIQVYQAPREGATPPGTATSAASGATAGTPQAPLPVPWTVPDGWTEKPASPGGMRVASYGVTTPDGRAVDISVVALGGGAGATLANVNRWRDQIGLDPLSEAELPAQRQSVKIGGIESDLFDMVGDKPVLDGKFKARTLAAIMLVGDTTVFFKATGEDALVAENKPKFLAWLKSVDNGSGSASTAPPPASPDMRGPVAPPPSTDLPQWQVPTGWKSVPPSTMRLATFAIAGANGQTGDLSVVALGPGAGGTLANVNRWRAQLTLAPLDEAGLAQSSSTVTTAAGDQVELVDLLGEGSMAGRRVLAAIVARPDRTWFFKLTGDDALVAAQKEPFLGFIKSVKYP